MRSSLAITSLCAALAVASPLSKKDLVVDMVTKYDIDTDVVYVTVTASCTTEKGAPFTVTAGNGGYSWHHSHSHSAPSPPPPAPTAITSTSVPVVNVTTSVEAAAPTTPKVQAARPTNPPADSYPPPPPPPPPAAPSSSSAAPSSSSAAPSSSSAAPPPPPPAASPPPATTDSGFQGSAVDNHNTARASHKASAMTWNQTLANFAAKEYNDCTKFEHDFSAGSGYGQNIAVAGSSDPNAHTNASALKDAIDMWYAEESMYGSLYGNPSPSEAVGDFLHFTQMVWLQSKTVGCAVQTCPIGNGIYPKMYVWYTICNYYPVGNVIGQFDKNVLP